MSDLDIKEQDGFKCKKTIVALSVISLVFTALSYIAKIEDITLFLTWFDKNIFSMLCACLPSVLLIICVSKFYGSIKTTITVPIILGLSLRYILDLSVNEAIPLIILFALAVLEVLLGFSKKIFSIISIAINMFVGIRYTIYIGYSYASELEYSTENVLFILRLVVPMVICLVGEAILCVALILLISKNKIPKVVSFSMQEKKEVQHIDPEQALRKLKNDRDLGIISEEDYQKKRSDIVRRL